MPTMQASNFTFSLVKPVGSLLFIQI